MDAQVVMFGQTVVDAVWREGTSRSFPAPRACLQPEAGASLTASSAPVTNEPLQMKTRGGMLPWWTSMTGVGFRSATDDLGP
jgi:hypothetical protein